MDSLKFFLDSGLGPDDAVVFATVFQTYLQAVGRTQCWCLSKTAHTSFTGFSTAHPKKPRYRSLDARPLALALAESYASEDEPLIIRRSCCSSFHCINPSHYYFGTRADVAMQHQRKRQREVKSPAVLTPKLVETLKKDKDLGQSVMSIARKHRLPYHVARRICNEGSYTNSKDVSLDAKELADFWNVTVDNCVQICKDNPEATRNFNLNYHMTRKLTCPWHKKNSEKHKGNFGLMGECLDCMEEIRKGRCSVDVTQFDIDWYWQVKRFWEQVEIKETGECWLWKGATRRNNKESLAYLPSPVHSGTAHSAPRVAFWLSRGYTGKHRVFTKNTCSSFCCNPLHLTLSEALGIEQPTEISTIKLNHANVFQHYRESCKQNQ